MKRIGAIRIDADKCTGCHMCETICSAFHNDGIVNPRKAAISIFWDEMNDVYVPILAGAYTDVECKGTHIVTIQGKDYGECSFCRSSCPSRDMFKEPDTQTPLKCDMCGEPPLPEPKCVKWCQSGALTYVEREKPGGRRIGTG